MRPQTDYLSVREQIEDGDILAFCGPNWISDNSGGPAYHIGMARWAGDHSDKCFDHLMNIQAKQWCFPSQSRLSDDVNRVPGHVNVLRAKLSKEMRTMAANIAESQTGSNHAYGWMSVVKSSVLLAPVIHTLTRPFWKINPDQDGLSSPESRKDCSQLAEWSYRKAGNGLIARKFDVFVMPNDIWHSAVLELIFTNLVIGEQPDGPNTIKLA